jgi:hypothetical protein
MEDYDPAAEDVSDDALDRDVKVAAAMPMPVSGKVLYDRVRDGEAESVIN